MFRSVRFRFFPHPGVAAANKSTNFDGRGIDRLPARSHSKPLTKPLTRADLDEVVACYRPGDRHKRKATWSEKNAEGRWRSDAYEELLARDNVMLALFWLRDESLEDADNLADPHVLAQEIADDLRSARHSSSGSACR